MSAYNRHPAGTPVGGQFAAGTRPGPAPAVTLLDGAVPDTLNDPRLAEIRDALEAARPERSPEYTRLVAAGCALELRALAPLAARVNFRTEDYYGDGVGFEVVPTSVRDAAGNDLGAGAVDAVRQAMLPRAGALGWDQLEEGDYAFDVDDAIDGVFGAEQAAERSAA